MYFTVEEAMQRWGCDRAAAIRMFKDIAAKGVCEFKRGRKGWPTRLER